MEQVLPVDAVEVALPSDSGGDASCAAAVGGHVSSVKKGGAYGLAVDDSIKDDAETRLPDGPTHGERQETDGLATDFSVADVASVTVDITASPTEGGVHDVKENRWKLAFRQLVFMKGMNMQLNSRTKGEIELRQHNITPLSLVCSVPFFHTFSPDQIHAVVEASKREQLRPGDTIALTPTDKVAEQMFFIIISGSLAIANADVDNARAIQQANLTAKFKLGIGDYFSIHALSDGRVIAMEPVEYFMVPMCVICEINPTVKTAIEAESTEVACESAEKESFKRWALQFTLAAQRHNAAQASELPSPVPSGLARCTMKHFSKELLLHLSPENELDHTLESMKNTLMTAFGARRVRIYVVDHIERRLIVKLSDDLLSEGSMNLDDSVASRVLQKKDTVFIPSMASLLGSDGSEGHPDCSVMTELYTCKDSVIVAPFFEFEQAQATTSDPDPAKIVGILEIVIERNSVATGSSTSSAINMSDNDLQILEVTTQELGRYLNYHYQDFFSIRREGAGASAMPVVEVFPAVDASEAEDDGTLSFNIDGLSLQTNTDQNAISGVVLSIRLGKMVVFSTRMPAQVVPQTESKSVVCQYQFDSAVHMNSPLADLPHGSHVMIHLESKSGVVAWTGLHLFDFGHGLRTGSFLLDISSTPHTSQTALEIENCLKRNRVAKVNVVGEIQLTLACSGDSPQPFAFSSTVKKNKAISFRASIFRNTTSEVDFETPLTLSTLPQEKQTFLAVVRGDPLVQLTEDDRHFVWEHRHTLAEDSALLPAFLLSVDWSKRDCVMEAYRLLLIWRQPTYLQALQLLSPLYSDPKVRAYAVRCIHSLPDHRLRLYLLQLVQTLKNERYHDSALARFLLMRALQNPSEIGYSLYWFLKAEAHINQTSERFELMMSQYLQLCGTYKLEIRQSVFVMKKLEEIASTVKQEPTKHARQTKLQELLMATALPNTFQLPLRPRAYCQHIIVEKCRVMESKKRPLLLQLKNAKPQYSDPYVIFKAGDDLRQDQLVLQILRVMDDLWREDGLDLCLIPYGCISTGDELGLIEVVPDSSTLATIIYDRHRRSLTKLGRKLSSAKDALVRKDVFSKWLFKKQTGMDTGEQATATEEALDTAEGCALSPTSPTSPTSPVDSVDGEGDGDGDDELPLEDVQSPMSATSDGDLASAGTSPVNNTDLPRAVSMDPNLSSCLPLSPSFRRVYRSRKKQLYRDAEVTQNLLRSCAGYCVATYVLGIGDRHNDNLMLQRSGKFFHIDFGHFLGNFKSKFGIKRERAPFVFTPAMLHAIGGKESESYAQFVQLSGRAFAVLRRHSNLLITLLLLALSCGIPELASEDDIKWVHQTLMLELSDEEANDRFLKLIHVALKTRATQLNDAVHLMAH